MKKLVSILLSITLLITTLAFPLSSVSASNPTSITVHFYNSGDWEEVWIYQHLNSTIGEPFPGTLMIDEGNGWYKYEIFRYKEMRVIFSNGDFHIRKQIPHIDQPGLLVSGEKWVVRDRIYSEKPEGIQVHYYNYLKWETPYLYYTNHGDYKDFEFPGDQMIDEGNGRYSYTVFGYDAFDVVFNDGEGQQVPSHDQGRFHITEESWFVNDTLYNEEPDNLELFEPLQIFFYNIYGWEDVYLYYYDTVNEGENTFQKNGKPWPGTKMEKISDKSYLCTIYGYEKAKVLFSNGKGWQIPPNTPYEPDREGYSTTKGNMYVQGAWRDGNLDSDKDELTDFAETVIGTNQYNRDTDEDGLPDGYEVNVLKTNPLKSDSDGDGTNDSEHDFDGDGLTNIQEYLYGTDPHQSDTDNDRLSDYDEIYLYATDPLVYDTDNDKLGDGVEISVGLNPLMPDSFNDGILDGNRTITQQYLPTEDEKVNIDEAGVVPSLEFTGVGDYSTRLSIQDVTDMDALSKFDFLVGHSFDFVHDEDLQFDKAIVSFEIGADILANYGGEDLLIACYDEENKKFELLESTYDPVTKRLSAETSHFSIYNVIVSSLYHKVMDLDNPNSIQPVDDYTVKHTGVGWGITLQPATKLFHAVFFETYFDFNTLQTVESYYEIMAEDINNPAAIIAPEQLRFTNCIVYKHSQNGTTTQSTHSSYMLPYDLMRQIRFVYTNRDIPGPLGYVAYRASPFVNTAVKVRLIDGTWITLDKDPRLGDRTVDSDGDGIPDLDELGEELVISIPWLTSIQNNVGYAWNYTTHPTKQDNYTTDEKDANYLTKSEQRKMIALEYILLKHDKDLYVHDSILAEIASIRRNCAKSFYYTEEEKHHTVSLKTSKFRYDKDIEYTVDTIKGLHRQDTLIFAITGYFGPVGNALSVLGGISSSIEQNGTPDIEGLLESIALSILGKEYSLLAEALSAHHTSLDVINEDRETYVVSADNFVVQDGDACLELMFQTNLSKEGCLYHFYFREGALAHVAQYDNIYATQYAHGGSMVSDRGIQARWLQEGYVSR